MPDHLGADLDQLLAQRGQGPVLDLLRQYRLLLMAINGLSGHVATKSALPPTADIRAPTISVTLGRGAWTPASPLPRVFGRRLRFSERWSGKQVPRR